MAHRRRSRQNSYSPPDVVTFPTYTPLAFRLFGRLGEVADDLTAIEDRRTYHPDDFFRPARLLSGVASPPVKVKSVPFRVQMPFGLQFAKPDKTVMCVRRKQRKEVLHALRKTGRGGAKRKRPRRNWYSAISC